MKPNRYASALSTRDDTESAVREVGEQLAENFDAPADLVFAFFSHDHRDSAERIGQGLRERLETDCVLGCTGESIVGTGREVEEGPALSVWAAKLSDSSLKPISLAFERTPDGGSIIGWPDELVESWPDDSALIILGEPFSFPMDALLQRLNEEHPRTPVMGGMASGAAAPGGNRLLSSREVLDQGAVAVLLHGDVRLRSIVSQGCRPIGQPLVITRAEQNEILELGGRPALLQLKQVFDTLPTHEQQLVQRGLHVGRVVSEYRDRFESGDFLVRNVVGLDADKGAVVINDFVRPGQTVQFHLRDEQSATDDLKSLLAADRGRAGEPPEAALLFTCNGRGTRLFSSADHDGGALREAYGPIPLAGFFAQGEIGPVGGSNFVHGFTASIVLF